MSYAALFFSNAFEVDVKHLEQHGAFNVSIVNDLPLFIDPFLFFNSSKPEYQRIHEEMIKYLIFLKKTAQAGQVPKGARKALFTFPEVKQNWLGFSLTLNNGRGLGDQFAKSIIQGFGGALRQFGEETISAGSHLEKLCLIHPGIGKDFISDFSTNMSLGYLAQYTEDFTLRNIPNTMSKRVMIRRASFNYDTNTWAPKEYTLPWYKGDYVLLTPKDVLTKDEAWINQNDLYGDFEGILESLSNDELREQADGYFKKRMSEYKEPKKEDYNTVATETISKWPEIIDYFIRNKEEDGDRATSIADSLVQFVQEIFVRSVDDLAKERLNRDGFGSMPISTHDEAMKRLLYLKDVIENKGGHTIFWANGKCLERENDVQLLFRLVWYGTIVDIARERNDGRGPADFIASMGAGDKTVVEFKMAKSNKLKQNLESQCGIYEKASDSTRPSIFAIVFFNDAQLARVKRILGELKRKDDKNIVMIDARRDNKPSGSKAA